MQRRTLFALSVALCGSVVLAGCGTIDSVSVEVSSQGTWQPSRKPGTYAIERLPSQQANVAEQERIEAAATQAIEAAGFAKAPRDQADVLIQLGARTFETVPRGAYPGSFYWRNDWWYYGRRPFFYGPGFGGGYYNDFPDVQRETAILIRDRRSEQVVYETRASYSSRWTSDALLPALFEASMKDFPTPALSPRTVTVALPKG